MLAAMDLTEHADEETLKTLTAELIRETAKGMIKDLAETDIEEAAMDLIESSARGLKSRRERRKWIEDVMRKWGDKGKQETQQGQYKDSSRRESTLSSAGATAGFQKRAR